MADKGEAREGRHTITGTHVERQSETKREDNTSGRQTHHPTQANVWRDNARQCAQWDRRGEKERRDLGKAGHAIQHRHTCGETMRDKTSGRRTHHPTQTHMREDNGKHWETRERQDIENANASSNTGTHVGTRQRGKSGRRTRQPTKRKHEGRHWVGDKGRQDQGEHLKNALRTPRAVHCLEDKKGDNVERRGARCLGRRTHQPTKGNKKGYRRRQKETRPSVKGKTLRKADAPSNKGKQEGGTMGDKTVRKVDTPSPQGTNQGHNGKHPRAGVQQRETRTGYNGRQRETRPSARRTHLPTRGVKKGYNVRHRETRPSERQTHHPGTMGNGRQRETRKKGYNGRQVETRPWGRRARHSTPRRPS